MLFGLSLVVYVPFTHREQFYLELVFPKEVLKQSARTDRMIVQNVGHTDWATFACTVFKAEFWPWVQR